MYRWLSDEPQNVLLIEWRICEVSRDNYETINFGLSEIVCIEKGCTVFNVVFV